ncbi:MAG: hypothetical protein HY553_20055 [Elusimicrobia bacterium]|nr:hypothetical protein [Elusimicrobiota bacterium]
MVTRRFSRLAAALAVAARAGLGPARPEGLEPEYVDLEDVAAKPELDRVLVHGTVTVHPEFERFVKPGGTMHLRVMNLGLRRPNTFKLYQNVRFPLAYEIRVRDLVSPLGRREMDTSDFYVEAFYAQPGKAAYEAREHQVGGEAWGKAGKPFPVRAGERADLVLASFWTKRLLAGDLKTPPESLSNGWIEVAPALRSELTKRNRLTLVLFRPSETTGRPHQVLAAKAWENIDPDRLPVAFHLTESDYRERPVKPHWQAFYVVRLDCYDERGRRVILQGARASEKVTITAFPRHFRIILTRVVPEGLMHRVHVDPHGLLDTAALGLDKLGASPVTYE